MSSPPRSRARLILSAALLMAVSPVGRAQAGSFGAPTGDQPVGYQVRWIADSSRSWAVPDSSGVLRPGPRFVRVHLWYPATPGTGKRMTFRTYMEPRIGPGVPRQLAEAIHANDLGTPSYSFRGIYRGDQAAFERAMSTPMAARHEASPARGNHPVVIYSVGQNDFTQDALSLGEFLASHGYIVATVPHLGTSARRTLLFVHDPPSYETQLRDLEVALGQARRMAGADLRRILAIGHSYGGIYALLLAMRDSGIRGVIGLDPTYVAQRAPYEYVLRRFAFYDPDFARPIATLRREGQTDRSLIDSLPHSDRLEIAYPGLTHGDFTTMPFLRRDLPESLQFAGESTVRSPQQGAQGAAAVFDQVLACAERILSAGRLDTSAVVAASRRNARFTAATRAPTHEELYWIYRARGLRAAMDSARVAQDRGGSALYSETRTITIAKELGYANREGESLDLFRLAGSLFPASASVQLQAAQALEQAGAKQEARAFFQNVLRLDPGNVAAKASLAKD
jgi:tetratricopeptide (TPR) repeat protein